MWLRVRILQCGPLKWTAHDYKHMCCTNENCFLRSRWPAFCFSSRQFCFNFWIEQNYNYTDRSASQHETQLHLAFWCRQLFFQLEQLSEASIWYLLERNKNQTVSFQLVRITIRVSQDELLFSHHGIDLNYSTLRFSFDSNGISSKFTLNWFQNDDRCLPSDNQSMTAWNNTLTNSVWYIWMPSYISSDGKWSRHFCFFPPAISAV